MSQFKSSVELPVSIEEAFAYHERQGALQRLMPPWENVTIESSDHSIRPGSRVTLKTRVAGVPLRWAAEHRACEPPTKFEDIALSGPFASWQHQHLFQSLDNNRALMTDQIDYQVPLAAVGRLVGGAFVRKKLESMFTYRHRITRDDLSLVNRYRLAPQTIAITGASGLLGRELMSFLSVLGHHPLPAQRQGLHANTEYSLKRNEGWSGCDTVIHLAGKPIADRRWDAAVKDELRTSRVEPTRRLCESLAKLKQPPKTFLCASAIGIYGNRGNEWLGESSTPGDDFLAEVGKQWEQACEPARMAGIRVVNMRFGIILSPRGGALAKMLMPAKIGLGGPMGSGEQFMSWIGIDDVLGAIYHAMASHQIMDAMNVVSPQPVTNRVFAKTLGTVLSRPAVLPAPAFALRCALGEMADALLLTSARVQPQKLESTGYEFRFPDLRHALHHLLGR